MTFNANQRQELELVAVEGVLLSVERYNELRPPLSEKHRQLCQLEAEGCGEAVAGMMTLATKYPAKDDDYLWKSYQAAVFQMAFCAGHWGRQTLRTASPKQEPTK